MVIFDTAGMEHDYTRKHLTFYLYRGSHSFLKKLSKKLYEVIKLKIRYKYI